MLKNLFENPNACSYDDIVGNIITRIDPKESSKIHLMVACHNLESINKAIIAMMEKSIDPQSAYVIFGQTYGFSDYISNWLGEYKILSVELWRGG